MTTYILLINWTDQGIRNVKDSAKRLDAARNLLGSLGGSFDKFYMTMGEYDMAAVCEAPDDRAMARFTLSLGMGGNVRTKTLKAFSEVNYRDIIASLA